MEVQKGEEEVEEATSDVWLPNRFHGKTNGFIFDFFSLENKLYAIKDIALNEEKNLILAFFRQCLKLCVATCMNTKRICIYHN